MMISFVGFFEEDFIFVVDVLVRVGVNVLFWIFFGILVVGILLFFLILFRIFIWVIVKKDSNSKIIKFFFSKYYIFEKKKKWLVVEFNLVIFRNKKVIVY